MFFFITIQGNCFAERSGMSGKRRIIEANFCYKMVIQYIISFYQIQQRMFTPNKKKSKGHKLMHQSFDPSDFVQLAPATQPVHRQSSQQGDKENVAKDILIEIGQSQFVLGEKSIAKTMPLSIDSWVSSQVRIRNHVRPQRVLENNFCYNRNTRSVTAGLIKYKDEEEQNTVRKLKEALKKLQSPQKPKTKTKKSQNENKNQILQSLMSKRKIQTKVSDLIRLKQCQNSKANGSSSNFHSRKISTSMENRIRKLEPPVYGSQPIDTKKLNQMFNFQYKEARKHRTLKGILH